MEENRVNDLKAEPSVKPMQAFMSSFINIEVVVEERPYRLLIPNGVAYEEVEAVCLEMAKLVVQLKEQAAERAKAQADKPLEA